MAGFFSVRLAPGLRISASRRGLRAHVGPRGARLHVGGGRTGVSTGAGPFTYYTSLPRPGGTGTAAASRQLVEVRTQAQRAKLGQAQEISATLDAIMAIHRTEFPPAIRPQAPPAPPVDFAPILAGHRKAAKRATSVFDRTARKNALAWAEHNARLEWEHVNAGREAERAHRQADVDAWWARLCGCDPDTVLAALAAAFEDNEAAAAAVGVRGTEVSLVVEVPAEDAIPERLPTTTEAGNLSLRRMTKTEVAEFYMALVAGYVLVTLREAFAVAPGLTAARIVAVRASGINAYGARTAEVILAARCTRIALDGVRWDQVDATRIMDDCLTDRLTNRNGRTGALRPVDLTDEPDLRAVVDAFDLDDDDVAAFDVDSAV
ncbi:DUF4236 domain-containing protein [Gordonia rhizosphera]|uniref:DUF4236 domain-containing protein n=1 Tax=Gordonia rhizosphera NBRC 16068 TaxID=1108045 RepID=K6X2W4_9ACTN|nr:DUF4236 domain-containing protein [Gordonia rhizosphera]GAB93144.1 hypothetical protein GORHZ_206_00480 [Gordonia rhizosphera NBRC 16068]